MLAACAGAPDASSPSADAQRPADVAASPALDERGYLDLRSVPPRPDLTYTVGEREAIARELVADRDNARYAAWEVRRDAGFDDLPPPPPVAAPSSGAVAAPSSGDPVVQPVPAAAPPPGADPAWAVDTGPAPSAGPSGRGAPPLEVALDPASEDISSASWPALQALAARNGPGDVLFVVGRGTPAEAELRARRVALALVALGVPDERIGLDIAEGDAAQALRVAVYQGVPGTR
jgi:hypothetical protein